MAAAPPGGDAAAESFAYHKSLGPMLGVLLGLALVESFVVHIVAVALWGLTVAIVLAVIDLSLVVVLVRLLRSFRRLPVTIEGGRVTLRAGTLRSVTIEASAIAGLARHWDATTIRRRDTLNLALAAWPNIVVELASPHRVRRRRIISRIAHRLDDPAAFHAAIARLERGDADRRAIAGA